MTIQRDHHELARTPPMGWNSWNSFRCYDLTEQVVAETADAMVSTGMRDAGYEYVVVDDCWQAFHRDFDGRLRSNPERFASGMVALGREIHARGLKFGLCLSPGRRTCAMIYARYPGEALGSYGHEQLDADTFAEWGVDYLKYDWCRANSGGTHLHEADAFASMAAALKRAGRPTVYSISEYGRSRPWCLAGALGSVDVTIGKCERAYLEAVARSHFWLSWRCRRRGGGACWGRRVARVPRSRRSGSELTPRLPRRGAICTSLAGRIARSRRSSLVPRGRRGC